MTKKNIIYIILFIIISIILTGCSNMQQTTEPQIKEMLPLVNIDYHIHTDGDIKEEYIEMAIEIIKEAPLYKNDFAIVITDYYLDGTILEENRRVLGQTDYTNKIIYIHQFDIKGTLLHELGHAVDRTYNLSSTPEFQALYKKVNKAPLDIQEAYYVSNEREYFADCYERFVNGTLIYGEVYEYFKNLEESF